MGSMEALFLAHHKTKRARKLLIEADKEVRELVKHEINNQVCKCGHKRKNHCVSHSINYTGGVCRKCSCLNFIQKGE